MSRVLVRSFGVTGFRSFDEVLQPLTDLEAVNLFVGKNNSGKSNILAALRLYCAYSAATSGNERSSKDLIAILQDPFNRPLYGQSYSPMVWTPLPTTASQVFEKFQDWNFHTPIGRYSAGQQFAGILETVRERVGSHGLVGATPPQRTMSVDRPKVEALLKSVEAQELISQLFNKYSGYSGGGFQDWANFVVNKIDPFPRLRSLRYVEIPSVRKVLDAGSAFDGTFGERAIIDTLAEWERPAVEHLDAHRARFSALLRFVRRVLEDESIDLQVPFQRNTIHVIKDGKTLPIERLGTGIHQVVMLAAAATVIEGCVVGIEEPETNLHPSLQRKLINYLGSETSNQYFITTHSGHVLDATRAAVFQVTLADRVSRVFRVGDSHTRFSAVEDLGYHASDLIQSPLVVWVEGPSDRTYIVAWLKTCNPRLVEGTHFSVMFYGGRLLSHLTPDDPEIADFISLRRLNRYVVVVIDSDRGSGSAQINATKSRIVESIEETPKYGVAWVTEGREIENCLDEPLLEKCFRDLAADFAHFPDRRGTGFRFADVLKYVATDGSTRTLDKKKVALAHKYVELSGGAVPSDASPHMQRICDLILQANAIDPGLSSGSV